MATQGRHGSTDWVSAYMLLYSDTGRVWKQYMLEDSVGVSVCFGTNLLNHPEGPYFVKLTGCLCIRLSHLSLGCLRNK